MTREALVESLRRFETHASSCGDRPVLKLTAEQLATMLEDVGEELARAGHNRAVDAIAKKLEAWGHEPRTVADVRAHRLPEPIEVIG